MFFCMFFVGFFYSVFCERAGGEGILGGSFSFHVLKIRILAEELRFIKESRNELKSPPTPKRNMYFMLLSCHICFLCYDIVYSYCSIVISMLAVRIVGVFTLQYMPRFRGFFSKLT